MPRCLARCPRSLCPHPDYSALPSTPFPRVHEQPPTLAMATDIHQVGDSSPPAYPASVDEKKQDAIANADAVDVEGSIDEESKRLVADRAEATELTPVEAFKWNVEGDQSPCKTCSWIVVDHRRLLTVCAHASSRSRGLCTQHRRSQSSLQQ